MVSVRTEKECPSYCQDWRGSLLFLSVEMTKLYMVTENGTTVHTHRLHIKMISLADWGVQHGSKPEDSSYRRNGEYN